jgi:glycosyltransferase involved in cell wall biosynthesis
MTNKKLLEVFTISYQESDTIMELINFYRERVPDCIINVLDNMSTDDTEKICKENNVNFSQFDTGGKMDEQTLINLRNNSWKNSDAKFVVMCDSDELVDVNQKDLEECYENNTWNVCKCIGYELYGYDKHFKDAFYGVHGGGYDKVALFRRDQIEEMNYSPGSHSCDSKSKNGVPIIFCQKSVSLYHTKWMNFEYGLKRQNMIKEKGRSEDSISKGWDYHYELPDSDHIKWFTTLYDVRIKIR